MQTGVGSLSSDPRLPTISIMVLSTLWMVKRIVQCVRKTTLLGFDAHGVWITSKMARSSTKALNYAIDSAHGAFVPVRHYLLSYAAQKEQNHQCDSGELERKSQCHNAAEKRNQVTSTVLQCRCYFSQRYIMVLLPANGNDACEMMKVSQSCAIDDTSISM